jgi:hypothetical protein
MSVYYRKQHHPILKRIMIPRDSYLSFGLSERFRVILGFQVSGFRCQVNEEISEERHLRVET